MLETGVRRAMASVHAGNVRAEDALKGNAFGGRNIPSRGTSVMFVLPALGAGGAERVVNIVANALAARGWRVSVVTFDDPDEASYYDYAQAVTLLRLGVPRRRQMRAIAAFVAAGRVRRLRRALSTAAPGIVISFLTRTNVLTLLAAIGTGLPVIVSERNNPRLQHFGPVWSWLRSRLYRRAYGLVTMTQGAMDCFPPALRPRHWVIPNPAVTAAQAPVAGGATKRLVAAGRLVPQKGFDLLLEAFARIAGEHPDWELVIWGEGPERTALENAALRLGIAARVRMPGLSARPGGWAAQGDLFVMSSRYEGWGNVLLEALGAGMPAIAFDCRWGPREMIDHGVNGMLVAPGDVAALAGRMSALMHDAALRARLGAAARRSVDKFAADDVVAAWEAIIVDAVAMRRASLDARPRPTIF